MTTIHAGALALGEHGVLIRGAPGTGKSDLARGLLARWSLAGRYSALVADDRTVLRVANGHLIARPAPELAGLAEVRSAGIFRGPFLDAVVLSLVVELMPAPPRIPEPTDHKVDLAGVCLNRVALEERMTGRNVEALWWVMNAARVDG
ncbi:MAG: serine/threonine protein kinase [Pseudomonadota bacterium]